MRTKIKIKTLFFSIIALIIGLVTGFSSYALAFSPPSDTLLSISNGDLSVHFLELGNKYAGDSIYIKANNYDILIDAGSRKNSSKAIINYVNNYCTDKKLEFVIATHAHQDHIAAFVSTNEDNPGIFDYYDMDTIIDFGEASTFVRNGKSPSGIYNEYVEARNNKIAESKENNNQINYIKASDYNNTESNFVSTFNLGNGIEMKILYNYYYDHEEPKSNQNNYSVCVMLTQGTTNVLLTGDLEGEGERLLVENYEKEYGEQLPKCELFKAAHHGSFTGSTEDLIKIIQPEYVIFTCVAGSTEYTDNKDNTFPSQAAISNVAKYNAKCYVTTLCTSTEPDDYSKYESMNGNIIFMSSKEGYKVVCDNDNTLLQNTDWFKQNRKWA